MRGAGIHTRSCRRLSPSKACCPQLRNQTLTNATGMIVGTSGMSYGGDETSGDSSQAQQYLLAQAPQRSRSLSDTSLRPPTWETMPMMGGHHQGAGMSADGGLLGSHDGRRPTSAGTVNMNDVLPGPSSSNPLFQPQGPSLRSQPLRLPASAGPGQSSFGPSLQPNVSNFAFGSPGLNPHFGTSDYLTPDIAAVQLRRAKSDSRGHRVVRSEDLRYGSQSNFLSPNDMMVPPPSMTQQEFLRNASQRQFLHPAEPVVSIRGSHHRRASSGSRERPGMGGVTGWSSGASSARASPYPSPSASPRPGYGPLPDLNGMPVSVSMTAMRRTPSGTMMTTDLNMNSSIGSMPMDTTSVPTHIAKVNVTTPSTADASQKRRKQPANFVCPVPGCGSTFTRHFNLKGAFHRV